MMRPWILQTERGPVSLTRIAAAWYAPARLRLPAWLEVRRVYGRGYTLRVLLGDHVEGVAYDPHARVLARVEDVALLDRDVAGAACRVLELARVQLLPARDKPRRASRSKKITFADREAGRRAFRALACVGDAVARGLVLEALRDADGADAPALRAGIVASVPGTCRVEIDGVRVVGWRSESAIGDRGTWINGYVYAVGTGTLDCGE
jgi:hypothetical protein